MSDFVNALTTGPKSQHKAAAGFATGAVMLAIFAVLVIEAAKAVPHCGRSPRGEDRQDPGVDPNGMACRSPINSATRSASANGLSRFTEPIGLPMFPAS
jgi:hypothetical protein